MTTPRQKYPHRRDPDGRGLCRVCGVRVSGRRRTFCSDDCVQVYLQDDWKFIRGRVQKRDRGVCAACGLDTEILMRVMRRAGGRNGCWAWFLRDIWRQLDFGLNQRALWEMDHILERARGGTNDLANLQTLCVPCHKDKTSRFSRERAQDRRDRARGFSTTGGD